MRLKPLLLLAVALPGLAFAQPRPAAPPDWPHEQDIVRAEPVALGLAGQGEPDVTRYLMVRGAGEFAISPDGRTIAYLSNVTGVPQIWAVPAEGGFPNQLTYGRGVNWLRASPDGRHILYGSDNDGDERVAMNLIDLDGTRERVVVEKSAAFRTFGAFSSDGRRVAYSTTERNGTDFDIHIADVETGATREVYRGRFGFYVEAWQPGGELLVVREVRGETGNDLHLLDARTGRLTTLFRPRRPAAYEHVRWLPDGSGFFLSTNQDGNFSEIHFYDIAARRMRRIEAPGRDIGEVELSHDGRYLAWTTIETGFERLHLRDLASGRDLPVPDFPAGTVQMRFAASAPVLALRIDGPRSAGELYAWNLSTGEKTLAVPVDTAGLDLASMAVPEPVSFRARDGVTLTGLLYMPREALGGGRPPVYLAVHGGPSSHARPSYQAELQYYVARGIAVLDLNYRGSTGHGRAFAELNDRELKANEVGDLADAVAWLRSTGRVDTDRVAVGGASYGGYLTNAALGTYPDMFVAGVSAVGVSDWVTALEGASPALKASDRLEYGDISDTRVREFFTRLSPINNAQRIRTPLLVLHGANDPRDPVTESDHFVERIRASGGNVTYLRFPDEGHGIAKLANRVHAYRRIAAFLEEQFTRGR
jgi:dipeptidyl aminopeptidase/acylaminoacyl peptidase